ncbi:MAG: tRNA 2-thiouridine(34) synthase MnmA, partial [Syntrophales bacterium]|nr:tRNA 2-thiouridine(34) synthase MnmA [Syntrophales bacterium]
SGGVDSSVAAFLLKDEGYEVTGVTMCLGAGSSGDARCCGPDAIADARRVCDRLHIPHYVFDFSRELEEMVIDKFIAEYGRGRTPNPCVDCNRYLKFGSLLEKASALGFDYVATGHYAKIEQEEGILYLKRPRDKVKDQTYFLYAIPYQCLGRIIFPLASLKKEEVRDIAKKADLPVADKVESQDLCFVDRQDFPAFVARRTGGALPGPIVDREGKRLGTHRGIVFYTVGQRGGLGIAHKAPLYVLFIDPAANCIIVGEKAALKAKGLVAGDLNVLVESWPREVSAKIRYRRNAARCDITFENDRITTIFREEEEAITPGQAVVFYHHDYVLGGGAIEEVLHGNC